MPRSEGSSPLNPVARRPSEGVGNLDGANIWSSPGFAGVRPKANRKQYLVVLKGVTMRSGQPFKVDELQATLDQEDGLSTETRFDCDLLYTVEKKDITQRRGEVRSVERRRDISRKIVQRLALAGL